MHTFDLPGFSPAVSVLVSQEILDDIQESWKLDVDLPKFKELLLEFPAFQNWLNTLESELKLQSDQDHPFHDHPYTLKSIKIQSVDWWGRNKSKPEGFVKAKAHIENGKGDTLPGIVFLRGGSVAVLMILRPADNDEEKYVIMTMQPRIPAGSLSFLEIPAGMLDRAGEDLSGKLANEIKEETGLTIPVNELKDMTKLALESAEFNKHLQDGMYPSPGGSDEYIPLFVWEKRITREEIMDLRDKLTGNRWQNEMITLKLVKYEELWKEGARDAKTLAAWALYEGLKREGRLPFT